LSSHVCKEEIEKLREHRPTTIFAASRIPGVRPTTLIFLHQFVRRKSSKKEQDTEKLFTEINDL